MAVEAKLQELGIHKDERHYPYLGIFPDNGLIVLFVSSGKGTVVQSYHDPIPKDAFGAYSDGWSEKAFEPLSSKKTVTLRNL